jgi:hypothetical protein
MLTYRAPQREFRFLLREVFALGAGAALDEHAEAAGDMLDGFLDGAARISEGLLLPLNASGDREGCRRDGAGVRTPAGFRDAWRRFAGDGWLCPCADPQWGGQGLPGVLGEALSEMLVSANFAFSGYVDLTEAAFMTIAAHGNDEQRRRYLPPLARGDWSGSMHLTEADAGTDLGLLRTRAQPQSDGSFRLFGTKTFITAAEHDMSDNQVGLVLARLPDAPPGTRGISLFAVPTRLGAAGALGERNAAAYSSIERKMGLRAAATGTFEYEGAWAEMIGEPHQGLRAMFTMVNDSRLGVALQGLGVAEIAAQNAAAYARERRQGRAPGAAAGAATGASADPIVAHPDVRRMLATMRAFTGGARALAIEVALRIDISRRHPEREQRERAAAFAALMTPVIKAYFTDMGNEAANLALQCFGGYGYIVDTGIEQLVRDVRVTRIYEGTNGIQALDLVGRKLAGDGGQAVERWCAEVDALVQRHRGCGALQPLAEALGDALAQLRQASRWMLQTAGTDRWSMACGATDYLRIAALVATGWSWLRVAAAANERLAGGGAEAPEFYRAQLAHAAFFMHWLLPEAGLCLRRVLHGASHLPAAATDPF